MVIPIGAVVSAATGVKKWSKGQGLFLVSVKQSIFKLGNSGQLGQDAFARAYCTWCSQVWRSSGQGPVCGAVKSGP